MILEQGYNYFKASAALTAALEEVQQKSRRMSITRAGELYTEWHFLFGTIFIDGYQPDTPYCPAPVEDLVVEDAS